MWSKEINLRAAALDIYTTLAGLNAFVGLHFLAEYASDSFGMVALF